MDKIPKYNEQNPKCVILCKESKIIVWKWMISWQWSAFSVNNEYADENIAIAFDNYPNNKLRIIQLIKFWMKTDQSIE